MGTMSVEVPEIDQLLAMTSPARYGDELPDEGGRGGALHLSSVLPAISSAIGHPIPTAIHADPKRLKRRWPAGRAFGSRGPGGRSRILEHQYEIGAFTLSTVADGGWR